MVDNQNHSLDLSTGSSREKRKRPWAALVLVLLVAAAAVWFWTAKDPEKRDQLVAAAKDAATDITAKVQELVPATANPVPPTGDKPPVQTQDSIHNTPEAQSGQPQTPEATNQPPAKTETGEVTRGIVDTNTTIAGQLPRTSRTDDAVVRVAFIDDLAQWMVNNYQPGAGSARGSILGGVQSANARYGLGMKGLAWIGDDLPAGRSEALRYVFTPGMLEGIYRLYIGRFMDSLLEASQRHGQQKTALSREQTQEMLKLYAGRFQALSGALQGITALDNLPARMKNLRNAAAKVLETNSKYMEAMFAFNQAREKDNSAAADKARATMESASETYQQAVRKRSDLKASLTAAVRNNAAARLFSDDDIVFVASWVDRRLAQSPNALEAARKAATLFQDLAQRLENAAPKGL